MVRWSLRGAGRCLNIVVLAAVHGSLGLPGWRRFRGFTLLSPFSHSSPSLIGLLASVDVKGPRKAVLGYQIAPNRFKTTYRSVLTFEEKKQSITPLFKTFSRLFSAKIFFSLSLSLSFHAQLKDGRLQALYNLGDGERTLLLNDSQASDGQWHVARFSRLMYRAVLTLDAGEGRNYVSQRADLGDNVYMTVATSSLMFAGAITTNPAGTEVIDRDLTDSGCSSSRLMIWWICNKYA